MTEKTCKKTEYASPRLVRYGDVRTITKHVANMSQIGDGSNGGMFDKTA